MLKLGDREVGPHAKPYLVAELGINHNGDAKRARKMIDAAKKSGADAVKVQVYSAAEFCTPSVKLSYKSRGRKKTERQVDLFSRCQLHHEEVAALAEYAYKQEVDFFGTPADTTAADLLYSLAVPAFKVGSDDLIHIDLLRHLATKELPIILSTGMGAPDEIRRAMVACSPAPVILLHCVSIYPAPPETWNLRRIAELRRAFGPYGAHQVGTQPEVLVGFSDHTNGTEAAVGAVYAGAVMVEKHFTLSQNDQGPDHWFSATPSELQDVRDLIDEAWERLGPGSIDPDTEELAMRSLARRVAVCATRVQAGQALRREHVAWKRAVVPEGETALLPWQAPRFLGQRVRRSMRMDEPITHEAISWPFVETP